MERVLKYKPELSKETLDSIKKYYIFISSNGNDIPNEEFHAVMTKSFTNN